MKNILLFILLVPLLISSEAYSQKGKASIGVFSGVSLNTNSYEYETGNSYLDTSYTNDVKAAFNLGMFVTYDFVENFGLKFQGQYTNKGGISNVNTYYSSQLTNIQREYTNTINYLQFALLPQLNIPFNMKAPDNKAYVNVGGYLSVQLSATESIYNQTTLQSLNTSKDISNSVSGSDAGLIFAAGIIYKGFLLDIRYDLGLSNIADDPVSKDVLNIKNRSLNFSLGWTGGL